MMVGKRSTDEWREAFVLQLRLRDVPGARIGEALAEVETHCADSGHSPLEAFGDPKAYAESLARGTGSPTSPRRALSFKDILRTLATLAGIGCLFAGANGVAHDVPGVLTTGNLVGVAAGAVGVGAIMALLFRTNRRRVDWL